MFEHVHTSDPGQFRQLREEVRTFIAGELKRGRFTPAPNSWMIHDRAFSEACAAAGYVGMTMPKAFGGHERSIVERHVVVEELLAAGAPVAAHWIADRQSGPQILRYGSERLKQTILPLITAGRCTFAIGMSEPDVGSDLASVKTSAERCDGGWRLHGTKLWTSNAQRADYLIALCRSGPPEPGRHSNLTQFVVDLTRPGVTVRPIENIAGDEDFCEVHFDGYRADDDEVLGAAGEGWALVMRELVSERSGPDRYLSTFPVLADALASQAVPAKAAADIGRLVVKLAALQAMSLSVASAANSGASPELEAVIVKEIGTTFEQELPDVIRKVLGSRARRGTVDEAQNRLGAALLYAPSFSLRGGTREIIRGIIARAVIGR
jgi:alkylation response protein AidB-like acyl-CoA dehydrogenase